MRVKEELVKLGLHFVNVSLGEVEVMENISPQQHDQLKESLSKSGLELMDDRKPMLIEKIKNVNVDMFHDKDELQKANLSNY